MPCERIQLPCKLSSFICWEVSHPPHPPIFSPLAGTHLQKRDKIDESHYRPISVLSVISRLFDRFVCDDLYQHLNSNNLVAKEQSGFRTLHSTIKCLLKGTDDWYSGLGKRQIAGLVLIDLKKAFDTEDHTHSVSKIRALRSPRKGCNVVQILSFKSQAVLYCK